MSPYRLTDPAVLTAAVEAVLAGTPADTAAADAAINLAEVKAAIETYRTGGQTALHHAYDLAWFSARLTPADWDQAEGAFREQIGPRLDLLDGGNAAWWFLRKHPHWRVRIRTANRSAAKNTLDELAAAGTITAWEPGAIYEPELAAFGGHTAMDIVHELFCADSRSLLAYVAQDPLPLGRRELSILLIRALQQHAGLDWYEAADVFDRVARMRPQPATSDLTRTERLADKLRPLLGLPAEAHSALFDATGALASASSWHDAYAKAGNQLAEAANTARLGRGLRATIAHAVIFAWNRLDLTAPAQGVLARAAATAILPGS
ncbi:thiopeptide-type bacteriocin biosynthesis protein [Catellatospora bangladeshensis]|uniref:Thiopeptide-type bacteriocin biosynthesis domain-containing protein n=1 Tax=Catellatospora bangladeshensis TaxID=310355 RepID=A0A8J3J9L4_9ACTN|nr:thiopeptide-type bacteriocin biosynthesis protein [Catellatospora bangladeshensis]GIF80867.1 hypothetical protein Cba03nite_22160 [Catellatospora bangladeshensis]